MDKICTYCLYEIPADDSLCVKCGNEKFITEDEYREFITWRDKNIFQAFDYWLENVKKKQ